MTNNISRFIDVRSMHASIHSDNGYVRSDDTYSGMPLWTSNANLYYIVN